MRQVEETPTPLTTLAALALAIVVMLLAGCGDDAGPAENTSGPNAGTTREADGAAGLPESTLGYSDWAKLNSEPIPPKASDPHLGDKDVFIRVGPRGSDRAAARRAADAVDAGESPYPPGTVIVKAAIRPDRDFVGLIAVMRKAQEGLLPTQGDWDFVQYTRESQDDDFEVIASDAVCASCHQNASATDYVFTRRG